MTLATWFRSKRAARATRTRPLSDATRDLADRLRSLQREGALDIPGVGHGQTTARHLALLAFGRTDLSLARVVEAHTDAIAILAEAGRTPEPGALYGVWASDGPTSRLLVDETDSGALTLEGTKRYCSGSLFLDRALVTAHAGTDLLLVDVSLHSKRIEMDAHEWQSPAFAATATGTVKFDGVSIGRTEIIGEPGWYLTRAGFWHGALGPASCWAGGAAGLFDAARDLKRKDPHSLAHVAALDAAVWGMEAILKRAGDEIDSDPADLDGSGRHRALAARHLIERSCIDAMDHFGRATGPALLAYDATVARRHAELALYIRQCHAERDLCAMHS